MLRRGDVVMVRSAGEIIATLDERGDLDGLPFMPEMLPFCGRTFRVAARVEKSCNTLDDWGSLRFSDTVLLDVPRCDGSGHAGCEAECVLYWREAWLRPAGIVEDSLAKDGDAEDRLRELAELNVEGVRGNGVYRCQATCMLEAAVCRLGTLDPGQYAREYVAKNTGRRHFVAVMIRALWLEGVRKVRPRWVAGPHGDGTKSPKLEPLGLQPGELVQVKQKDEIVATLTVDAKNRGLFFDREMLQFCGSTHRVRRRVTRLIDERTGTMINLGSDCVTLEGVVCSGEHSLRRWFCPRAIYPYWREGWLRRLG